jgi:hypothetical protein
LSEKDPAPSGLKQEEVWRKRLAEAELAYHQASMALEAALRDDVSAAPALRERKTHARVQYLKVLRIFTDLVLRGKSPPK